MFKNTCNTVLLYCCLNAQPQEKSDWRDTAPEIVAVMQGMTAEALLKCLADMNVPAAEQLQVGREEAREIQAASRKALADASIFHLTNEGRRTSRRSLRLLCTTGMGRRGCRPSARPRFLVFIHGTSALVFLPGLYSAAYRAAFLA